MQWTSGSPQAARAAHTDCGAAGARTRTRMAGVCASLDRDNQPGRVTRLLRLERLDRFEGGDLLDRAEPDCDPRCTFGCKSRISANRQR